MDIGIKTIESIIHMIDGLLNEYQTELSEAYQASEGAFTIPINIKIRPDSKGNKVRVAMKFTKEQVTAELEDIVDDAQIEMEFTTEEPQKERKDKGDEELIMKLSKE